MSDGELPPLSTQARELLAQERARGPEDAAVKLRALERAREALQQDRPSGVAFRASHSVWPAAPRRAPRTLLLIAAALGVAGLSAAGAGLYGWQTSQVAERPVEVRSVVAPRPPAVAPGPLLTPSVVREVPSPAQPERPKSAAQVESAAATSIQTYAIEAGLLEPARRSIGSGNYAAALTALARHQREYPRGQLAQEREALRVRALWGMGQKPAAESAAAAFRKRYPRSGLLSWMKEPAKPEP
jgi:hypothetical protein